ncbi:hypothetical protein EV714DRAFT_270034 [Schizophyllum commune]
MDQYKKLLLYGDYEQDDWLVSDSEPIELANEDSDVGESDREASASRDVGNDTAEDEDTGEPVVEEGGSGDDELSDASEYKLQRLRRGRAVPPGKARSPSLEIASSPKATQHAAEGLEITDSNADSEPERDHAPQTPRRPKRVASRLTIMTFDTNDDDDDGVPRKPARRSSRSDAAEHAHLASPDKDEDDVPRTLKKRRTSIRPSSPARSRIGDKAVPATPAKVHPDPIIISSEEDDDNTPLSVHVARKAKAREESLLTPAKSKFPAAARSRPSAAISAGSPSRKIKSKVSTSIRAATPSLAAIDMNAYERPGEHFL